MDKRLVSKLNIIPEVFFAVVQPQYTVTHWGDL
jgi:hypothetical protein